MEPSDIADVRVETTPDHPRQHWYKVEMYVLGIDPTVCEDSITEDGRLELGAAKLIEQIRSAPVLIDGLRVTDTGRTVLRT